MIDLKLLQKDFDNVAAALIKKKVSNDVLEQMKQLFLELRDKKKIFEDLKALQNQKK
jgi:seryl-tRNA synthetase